MSCEEIHSSLFPSGVNEKSEKYQNIYIIYNKQGKGNFWRRKSSLEFDLKYLAIKFIKKRETMPVIVSL